MKIACFSDLHMHTFKEFDEISDRTGSKRLDNIVESVEYIRDYCFENKITQVIFAGDAFHTRGKVDILAFNSLYDVMKTFPEYGIEVVMIAGNHDQSSNAKLPPHALHSFGDIEGIKVYGDLGIHQIEDDGVPIDIVCVPYNKDAQRIKDWISEVASTDMGYSRILVGHLGVSGATVGSTSYPMAEAFSIHDLKPDYFHYIVMGHFHKRQFLGGYPNSFYCGAPIQHSFSDEGEDKGFYIIDTDKRYEVTFVPIPNPMFRTVTLPISEELVKELEERGDYVRIKANEDNIQDFTNSVSQDLKYKVELERVYEEQTRVDVKIGMGFSEIISKYAEEFNPEAKEIGLKILSNIRGE